MNNRRQQPAKAEQELYQLSKSEVAQYVTHERRKDELARLHEVRRQKRVWWTTILVCFGLNLALLGLAIVGWRLGVNL